MKHSQEIARILAQFPGPVVLRRSYYWKGLDLAVGILLFAGALLYMSNHPSIWGFVTGVLAVGLASFFVVRKPSILLDLDGFVAHLDKRWKWRETSDFRAGRLIGRELVCFNVVDASDDLVDRIDRFTLGRDKYIYARHFGISSSDLATLMNAWRERALRATG